MSYSFGIRAATKALAIAAVAAKLDEVVQSQPVHKADRAQAQAAAEGFVNVLKDDDTKDITVSVNGSVSWQNVGDDERMQISSASVSVSAYLVPRDAAA
jgi:glycosyltransferase A (GT-A) superfamily protein (DUF2064 family)